MKKITITREPGSKIISITAEFGKENFYRISGVKESTFRFWWNVFVSLKLIDEKEVELVFE